jgi:hypothetical protein
VVRLYNLRSRLIGWNQIKTTYLRESQANFRELLRKATDADDYLRRVAVEAKDWDLGL